MGFNICQWTAERIAMLRRLWVSGMPASKIAKEMGSVTRNGVIGKAHRLGIAADHHANAPPAKRKYRHKPKPTTPPAALFVVPAITDLPPETSPDGCTLMQLAPNSCRWPISGEPRDIRFCGAQIWSGSYCRKHAKVAWKSMGK